MTNALCDHPLILVMVQEKKIEKGATVICRQSLLRFNSSVGFLIPKHPSLACDVLAKQAPKGGNSFG